MYGAWLDYANEWKHCGWMKVINVTNCILQTSGIYCVNFNNEMATRKNLLGIVKVKKTVLLSDK